MKKISFVGAGNMAGALLKGMLQAGQLKPDDVWASDPVDARLNRLGLRGLLCSVSMNSLFQ